MLYTPMTKAALKLCFDAHNGQVDKSGLPYVFHPFHLAEQMDSEEAVCVALLHDVMEDTDLTADDMRSAGMSDAVVNALLLMTHDPAVDYMEYIEALSRNALARKVKMADLRHNSDRNRIENPTDQDERRWEKYARALSLLERFSHLDSRTPQHQGEAAHNGFEFADAKKRHVAAEARGEGRSSTSAVDQLNNACYK